MYSELGSKQRDSSGRLYTPSEAARPCFPPVPGQEADDKTRVSEAVTKAVVGALKATPSADNMDDWLNPTEVVDDVYTILLIIYNASINQSLFL